MNDSFTTGGFGGTVPDIIGYPGHQTDSGRGFDEEYEKIVNDKLVIATMKPLLPGGIKDANIYDPKNAIGKYKGDLKQASGATLNGSYLKIALSTINPVTTSFQNNYGDSSILPQGNMLGQKASELMTLTGAKSFHELRDKLGNIKDPGILEKLGFTGVNAITKALDFVDNASQEIAQKTDMPMLGAVGKTVSQLLDSPWSKVGWPQMWKDCSFESQYQVNTRLYCFNVSNDDEYKNNIMASIAALMLFVAPRSDTGMLYTAPFMCQFEIPGMVYFPMAYISNMTFVKGGDGGDFSATGRPNVVDVNFTVNNCYGVCVNSADENTYPYRPTVKKEIIGLASGRNLYRQRDLTTGSISAGQTMTYEKTAIAAGVNIKPMDEWSAEKDSLSPRIDTPQQTQQAAEALQQAGTAS